VNQGLLVVKLKSSLRKCHGLHHVEPIITNYIIGPKYELFIIYNVISEIGMLGRKN
jgi:hypothetical protein